MIICVVVVVFLCVEGFRQFKYKFAVCSQDLLLKSTLDSIFKVGFGVDLNTLSGLDELSNQFMKAFDESNFLTFWRFADLSWRIKRFFKIGFETTLKKNIEVIDNFVYELIRRKREQMKNGRLDVSTTSSQTS